MCSDFFLLRIQSYKSYEAIDIFSHEMWNHKHHNFHVKKWIRNFFYYKILFILSDVTLSFEWIVKRQTSQETCKIIRFLFVLVIYLFCQMELYIFFRTKSETTNIAIKKQKQVRIFLFEKSGHLVRWSWYRYHNVKMDSESVWQSGTVHQWCYHFAGA